MNLTDISATVYDLQYFTSLEGLIDHVECWEPNFALSKVPGYTDWDMALLATKSRTKA